MIVQQFWDSIGQVLGPESHQPTAKEGCLTAIEELLRKAGENHAFQPLMAMIEDGTHHIGNGMPADAKKSSNTMERAVKKNVQTLLRIGFLHTARDDTPQTEAKNAKNAKNSADIGRKAFSRSSLGASKSFKYLESRTF